MKEYYKRLYFMIKNENRYSKLQLIFLLLLRFLVGWHLLFEGVAKVLNSQWSSIGFLQESKWILSGFAQWIISNPTILNMVDFLNTWGLIAIGLGLILGLFFRTAAIAGSILLLMYYLNSPPMVGFESLSPADGNNLIVNKTLIEAVAISVLALFSTSRILGLDVFVYNYMNRKKKGEGC